MVFGRFKALFPRNFLLHINNLPENVTIALLDSGIIFQRTSDRKQENIVSRYHVVASP